MDASGPRDKLKLNSISLSSVLYYWVLAQPLKESPAMETLFTTPVNKTNLSYDLTTGDKLVRSGRNVLLARLKLNNIACGWPTVNIIAAMS